MAVKAAAAVVYYQGTYSSHNDGRNEKLDLIALASFHPTLSASFFPFPFPSSPSALFFSNFSPAFFTGQDINRKTLPTPYTETPIITTAFIVVFVFSASSLPPRFTSIPGAVRACVPLTQRSAFAGSASGLGIGTSVLLTVVGGEGRTLGGLL